MVSLEPEALFEERRLTCHECGSPFEAVRAERFTAIVADHSIRDHGLDA